MPLPEDLVNRYKQWKNNSYKQYENLHIELAKSGQKPTSMIISCCDSRVQESHIFDAKIGDFFVHKNIANIVPKYKNKNENNTAAALEFAVKVLKVQHIVVIGHTNCGGIKYGKEKLLDKITKDEFEFVDKWVETIQISLNNLSDKLHNENLLSLLEKENVKTSINNLLEFPFIKDLIDSNKIQVHGTLFNISSGSLEYLNLKNMEFESIDY